MRFVGEVKIVIHPRGRERRSQGVDDEDHCNEEAKDFVCKSRGIGNDSIEVGHSRNYHIDAYPDTDPGIEDEEGNVQRLRQFVENLCKCEHRTSTAVDHDWLPANQGVDDAAPRSCRYHFDGTDVVVGCLGVYGTERDGGGNAGKEEEEGYRQGLAVEIGHVPPPILGQSPSNVGGDASAPTVAISSAAPQDVMVMVVGLQDDGVVATITGRRHGRGESGGRLLLPLGTRRRRRSGLCTATRHGCICIFTAVFCWIMIVAVVVVVVERICLGAVKIDGATTGRDDLHGL